MKNKYLDNVNKRSKGYGGSRRELELADDLRGRLTVGSGSKDGDKGDIVHSNNTYSFRSESKTTYKKSLILKLDWLLKIKQEALEKEQIPSLLITFILESGKKLPGGDWVLIPQSLFKEVFCEDLQKYSK
jgi:hypothetical protein